MYGCRDTSNNTRNFSSTRTSDLRNSTVCNTSLSSILANIKKGDTGDIGSTGYTG